jgi:two-component system sensor histidine kinase UhpB
LAETQGMTEELRRSGIDVLGDIHWGTHCCQFYETKEDLLDLLIPYFKAGLETNEYCVWVTGDPVPLDDALQALRQTIPGFDHFLQKKSMEILTHADWYLTGGKVNSPEIINRLDDKLNKALASGYDGMRVNGNESWLEPITRTPDSPGEHWDDFMNYERELNTSIKGKRMIVLCTYPLLSSNASSLLDVAHSHERVIAKRKGAWEILEEAGLKEIKSELLRSNFELEQKVEVRTRELISTIAYLQIEIDQRKRTEEELKKSELRYRTLVEQASDAILITDQQGNLIEANTSFRKMFGYSETELNGINLKRLVDPEQLRTDPLRFDLLLAGAALLRDRRMRKKDGTIFDIEENVKMLPDGRILAVVRDSTQRKQAEDALRRNEDRIRLIIDTIPIMAWSILPDGTVDFVSQRWMDYAGLSLEQESKEPMGIIHPEDLPRATKKWLANMAAGEPSEDEMRLRRADGEYRWFLVRTEPLRDEKGNLVKWYGVSADIEDSKRAQDTLNQSYEEIRRLTEHLLKIREEERTRIARELHDELGQQLTVLKMDVSWLTKRVTSTDDATLDKIKDLYALLDSTMQSVRRISHELRPVLLDELGLPAAMEWHLKEFEKRSAIKTYFSQPEEELQLDDTVKTNLFRIFQESLTNVARHSKATEVKVDFAQDVNQIALRIEDNGLGFNKKVVTDSKTLGILGMRERAASFGWHYEIKTEPGHGTTVLVTIPFSKNTG